MQRAHVWQGCLGGTGRRKPGLRHLLHLRDWALGPLLPAVAYDRIAADRIVLLVPVTRVCVIAAVGFGPGPFGIWLRADVLHLAWALLLCFGCAMMPAWICFWWVFFRRLNGFDKWPAYASCGVFRIGTGVPKNVRILPVSGRFGLDPGLRPGCRRFTVPRGCAQLRGPG